MIHIPVLRWGEPYKSLEVDKVVHFATGEVLAEVSRANGGLVERDMRHAQRARDVLREIPIKDLLQMVKKAGDLYTKAELPLGDGTQTPDQFVRMQSATTGLPEHMCRFNMEKNHFVLSNMDEHPRLADARPRPEHPVARLRRRGPRRAGQLSRRSRRSWAWCCRRNSPGVHTLWLPIIPLQVGLVLKPGPQEPWTPYRMANAFIQAGVPEAGHRHLSRPRRRRRRGAAALPAQPDLRRHGHGRAVQGQPARAGPRPRLQQDPPRRRQGRRMGEVPRHHGRQRLRQQRPRLHQLLRHLGVAAHARRSPRPSPRSMGPVQPLAAGGSRSRPWPRSPCRARPTPSTPRSTRT